MRHRPHKENKMKNFKYTVVLLSILMLGNSTLCQAQLFKGFGKKLEKKIEERIERKADRHVDKALDKADKKTDEPIDDALYNKKKKDKKTGKGKTDTLQTPDGNGMGEIVKNYDFIPGERTIFETNFSDAVIGNFPRNLESRGGELSVVSYSGGRAIAANSIGSFAIKLPETLPERFTIEFNLFNSEGSGNKTRVEIVDANFELLGEHFIRLEGYERRTGIGAAYGSGGITSLQATPIINEEMTPIRVMVDGTYVKMYVGTKRVANMPNADLGRSNTILFDFHDVNSSPVYVTDIRIAAGGRNLYQALEETGRVAIHDIHFATGKADILPQSAETIGGVAKLLQEHPDLKLLIEGHTDNTGDFEKNMHLSKERAAAVKTYLVNKFNIDESRLETMGLGQSRPTDTNDTDEGRAKNRRVEIVKM